MNAMIGVGAAMAASTSDNLRPQHMRPQPIPMGALRSRALDGSYPFRSHRTVAELWSPASAGLPAARAAAIEVDGDRPSPLGVVSKLTDREVAGIAQNPTQLPCRVAVVDCEPLTAIVATADVARGHRANGRRLLAVEPVSACGDDRAMVLGAIASVVPLGRSPLGSVPDAILPHPQIFAFPAPELPKAAGYVIEAEIGQRKGPITPRTRFVLHNTVVAFASASTSL